MIPRRIIPIFLLKGKRLVKGMRFGDFTDVGDPVSQAMIYDAQGADEIVIVDINAARENRIMDTAIINEMITKCRLPIGAGGGIKSIDDARKYFKAGADKIVINTNAAINPVLVRELAGEFGSQSIVVSIDVKRSVGNSGRDYDVYVYSGKEKLDAGLDELIEKYTRYGAGEMIITSVDNEGTLSGFDYGLYKRIRDIVSVPLIASGGAGRYDDMVRLFKECGPDACGIGKMLFLRDYDIVRIKSYLKGEKVKIREA